MDLSTYLESIGLDHKEAQCYLALVEHGPNPATIISKKTDINRSSIHYIMKSLQDKGFVHSESKNNTMTFIAEPPEAINDILDQRTNKISEQKNSLQKLMQEFKRLNSPHAALPQVRYYNGQKEVEKMMLTFAKEGAKKKLRSLSTFSLVEFDVPTRIQAFRKNADFSSMHLIKPAPMKRDNEAEPGRENPIVIKYYNGDRFKTRTSLGIAGNSVSLMSVSNGEPMGILITQEDMANFLSEVFDELWENCST